MSGLSKIGFGLGFMLLMLFKVSAFHIYEHADDHESHKECNLCDLAMENQIAELHFSFPIEFTEKVSPIINITSTFYRSEMIAHQSSPFDLCSRPPPSILV